MTDENAEDADPPPGDGGHMSAEELLAEIREHDEVLAEDVRQIIERGAELHDAAGELEATVEERNREIADLEDELEAREERIRELEAEADTDAGEDDADDAEAEARDADADEDDEGAHERVAELEASLREREERIDDLERRLDEKGEEVEDLTTKLRRKQADFENYKKRAERKREQIRERATEDLVERLLDVRDNLKRALENDHEDVESLKEGVEMTLREFDRVLEDENVEEIAPDPGEDIDPQLHEVMMRVDSENPEDTVADLYAPGYRMADKVIRPAQVTVSTGPAEDDEEAADDAATAAAQDGDE